MSLEDTRMTAESYQTPLIIVSIIVIALGLLKLTGSISLCIIECLCGIILVFAALNKSYTMTVFYMIFELFKMLQFIWIFGQIVQITIATQQCPLFYEFLPSAFLWVIIVTFLLDIFFVSFAHRAYISFKTLEY